MLNLSKFIIEENLQQSLHNSILERRKKSHSDNLFKILKHYSTFGALNIIELLKILLVCVYYALLLWIQIKC